MFMNNLYLVAPLTNLNSGSAMASRKITVHRTHQEAVDECIARAQDQRSNQKFVVYRSVTLVGRTDRPVEICDIDERGDVSCR